MDKTPKGLDAQISPPAPTEAHLLPLPAEGTPWGQDGPLPSPPALECLLVLSPDVTLKSPAGLSRHFGDWAASWEVPTGWVRGVAQASALSNAPPAASSVRPELGAAGQRRPPRCCSVGESSLPPHRDAGVRFPPAPAAWLASAVPTKPAPPRQAGSAVNFNSRLFLFIIFKCSRP